MVNFDSIKSEKGLRVLIKRNLNKEIHPGTKPSIDFIYKILEDAYSGGLNYDVSDMHNDILAFAAHSTNQADYCIKLVNKMHFKSEEPSVPIETNDNKLIFNAQKLVFVLNNIYGIISKNVINSYLQQTASPAKNIPRHSATIFFLSA